MVKILGIAEQERTSFSNPILSQLRERTGTIHRNTEALPLMSRLADGRATATDYTSFLATLLPIYTELEKYVFINTKLIELLPDLNERRKVSTLRKDLSELALHGFHGRSPDPDRYAKHFAPARDCLPSALGFLYVVEGSSLGGIVLFKALSGLLRSLDYKASSFLRGYDSRTQSKWKVFCETLNSITFVNREEEILLDKAVDMFEIINSELKDLL
jgi:heme oxygenase (biliverdin-IX-beta and delta-forming)